MTVELPMYAERTMRVGELAKQTGKTVRALHLYEERGLLKPVERSKGGYRLYGADAVRRVRWIVQLQELGLSLPSIKGLLHDYENAGSAPDAMVRISALYQAKLEETQQHIERLQSLKKELQKSLAFLAECENNCQTDESVHACCRCERHSLQQTPPVLVTGLTVS